ncbi:MAG: precorrin-6A synthase (deacetylating) [Telmatospirillum sp.]|nr:precorrin-6A synthase (deacetylating) [Telmatospirillum sp.]
MKKILIIGIGAGNPGHLTLQAVDALNRADAFFIMDKGPTKEKLTAFRKAICERHITGRSYRFIDGASPEWQREHDTADYLATIDKLNQDKEEVFERMIVEGLGDDECGAFLVWGDPPLYDSTIRIVGEIAGKGLIDPDFEVIPGISCIQALTARHRITLNQIGGSVQITTGRRLAQGWPDGVDSVVVMLDAENSYKLYADQDMEIYWGAYVGTPDEIVMSGRLKDVAGRIEQVRAEARRANGWIMDTYLLRRITGGA